MQHRRSGAWQGGSYRRAEEAAMGAATHGEMGRWRGASKQAVCSWQCFCLLLIASSALLYTMSVSRSFCHAENRNGFGVKKAAVAGEAEILLESDGKGQWRGDVRELETAWNRLCFGPPPEMLRMALFVKKWPVGGVPGGLERHALTLHKVLADRGHDVHVYTISADGSTPGDLKEGGLHVHFLHPNAGGGFDYNLAWEKFSEGNRTRMFDVVHTESVALPHWRAKEVPKLAASWHGIAYEVIHSDVVHDLIRKPGEPRSEDLQKTMSERLFRVSEEVKFFHSYNHHVATSDFVGDVLRTIYEIPLENVHIILNGVDEVKFRPDPVKGAAFRAEYGIPANASLVLGAAGRLVRDKGHPILFEAFSEILLNHTDVYLLVAGDGPWGDRYRELEPYAKMLGPMTPWKLAEFYNALDIFVNPTLRSQGLDHTLLEAMQCGKPLLATHFSSITRSVIVHKDLGYTFSPNAESLTKALRAVIKDGKKNVRKKGQKCLEYASLMFTASKMGTAYERLFLCMKDEKYCQYPLPTDCPVQKSNYF
ncbi:hypothetical protein O6H91_01G154200 [Diphasiastrum complanatum]|uniref:Uncharacterized protein n=1 Tax=Diphasiastrum complanatum TaxID=34168 RepID=A0ACC2EXN9_DIPCM|nr:hypothetical protein O6H91_01G154200 [Diphasiastrum complanatum]